MTGGIHPRERKSSRELAEGADLRISCFFLDINLVNLRENSEAGYDLQLSGHTHGDQIWPMGFLMNIWVLGK